LDAPTAASIASLIARPPEPDQCWPGAGAAPGVIKHRATHTGLRRLRTYHSTFVCRLKDTARVG